MEARRRAVQSGVGRIVEFEEIGEKEEEKPKPKTKTKKTLDTWFKPKLSLLED
jgi:hypothetical protein